jgi:hypothetical protein
MRIAATSSVALPVLVGAVGVDFADENQKQIALFYPGAMRAAGQIELAPVIDRIGDCLDRGLRFAPTRTVRR